MAETKGYVNNNSLFHFQLDPSICWTVRAFSSIFPKLRRTALFTRIDPRCILVDISPTSEQCISVNGTCKGFCLSHRHSTQRFKNKEEISSRSYQYRLSASHQNIVTCHVCALNVSPVVSNVLILLHALCFVSIIFNPPYDQHGAGRPGGSGGAARLSPSVLFFMFGRLLQALCCTGGRTSFANIGR